MSAPPYMRMYWPAYFTDTPHLSRSQHGAYLLLIARLWNAGGKLPADDATLAQHAMCNAAEWKAIKPVVLPYFKISRGYLTNKRVTEELTKYADKIGKLKEAGRLGGEASRSKRTRNRQAKAKQMPNKSRHIKNDIIQDNIILHADAEARPDGASALRVVEGDRENEREWLLDAARADDELFRCRRTDPDRASELAEFISYAKTQAVNHRRAAA